MDNEQFRMVIEAMEGMGSDAKIVLIWWLVMPTVNTVVNWLFSLVLVSGIGWAAWRAGCAIAWATGAPWLVAHELGVEVRGGWGPTDTRRVLEAIRRLKEGGGSND